MFIGDVFTDIYTDSAILAGTSQTQFGKNPSHRARNPLDLKHDDLPKSREKVYETVKPKLGTGPKR